jgi:N-acetylmuramoyl-L-alanine amidase
VQTELVRALGFPDRGIQERSDYTGFNWADVPVILVELGFMTNPTEDRALASPAVRQRAALGLCRGTLRFLGLPPVRCAT